MQKIKYIIQRILYRLFLKSDYLMLERRKITYQHDLLWTYHNADFLEDARFMNSYKIGKATDKRKAVTKDDYDIYWRVHVLCWAATMASKLEGDFVDCGVHTGICPRAIINYIDFNSTKKTYYLVDTYEGLSEKYSTPEELKRNQLMGYASEGDIYEEVKKTFEPFNCKVIKGIVPDTLPLVDSQKIAFLHVDMNCVQPEYDALNYFWDKMTKGGIIILDDYGYGNATNDQREIHKKFAREKGVEILSMPTCQGIIIKS